MTMKSQVAASLEQLTGMCLNILERLLKLALEDQPELKKEETGTSSSGPKDEGKEKVQDEWN
jgi:hypothetical protein